MSKEKETSMNKSKPSDQSWGTKSSQGKDFDRKASGMVPPKSSKPAQPIEQSKKGDRKHSERSDIN
jgi:hypothetical protein